VQRRMALRLVRLMGLEPMAYGLKAPHDPSNSSEKQGFSASTGPKTGPCPNDPEFERIAAAWSSLPAAVKQSILMLVQAATHGR